MSHKLFTHIHEHNMHVHVCMLYGEMQCTIYVYTLYSCHVFCSNIAYMARVNPKMFCRVANRLPHLLVIVVSIHTPLLF
jgi:hypothetical protein